MPEYHVARTSWYGMTLSSRALPRSAVPGAIRDARYQLTGHGPRTFETNAFRIRSEDLRISRRVACTSPCEGECRLQLSHWAFAEVCGQLLEEAEELFDFEPCYYRGKGSRSRNLAVDGYAIDDADKSMRLLVAEFSGQPSARTITRTDAKGEDLRCACRVCG